MPTRTEPGNQSHAMEGFAAAARNAKLAEESSFDHADNPAERRGKTIETRIQRRRRTQPCSGAERFADFVKCALPENGIRFQPGTRSPRRSATLSFPVLHSGDTRQTTHMGKPCLWRRWGQHFARLQPTDGQETRAIYDSDSLLPPPRRARLNTPDFNIHEDPDAIPAGQQQRQCLANAWPKVQCLHDI